MAHREAVPFHTEIGYWFWDAEHELVMRAHITPRGIVVLAGGTARPDATALTVSANAGEEDFGILSNPHQRPTADTTQFRMTVDLSAPDEYSYDQQTFMYQPRQRRSALPPRPKHPHAHQVAAADPAERAASANRATVGRTVLDWRT